MSRVEFEFDKTTNSWFIERPFKDNLDLPEKDQMDFVLPKEKELREVIR